jgi:hypothetical protein
MASPHVMGEQDGSSISRFRSLFSRQYRQNNPKGTYQLPEKGRKKNLRSMVFLLSFQALNAAPRTFSVWAQNVAATKIRQSSFFLIFKEIL